MIRAIIVDDDKIIRHGLLEILTTQVEQVEVVGEAGNGESALQLVRLLSPELCFVDIRMPVMDGLTFMERVRETDSHIRFVVLSAYADFEYARKTLSIKCSGYLLKPIVLSELQELIKMLQIEIDMDRSMSLSLLQMQQQAEDARRQALSQHVLALLSGHAMPLDQDTESGAVPSFLKEGSVVIVFSLDEDSEQAALAGMLTSMICALIGEWMRSCCGEDGLAIPLNMKNIVYVGAVTPFEELLPSLKRVQHKMRAEHRLSLSVGTDGQRNMPSTLPLSLEHALSALERRFHEGSSGIFLYAPTQRPPFHYPFDLEARFRTAVAACDAKLALEALESTIIFLSEGRYAPQECMQLFSNLYLHAATALEMDYHGDYGCGEFMESLRACSLFSQMASLMMERSKMLFALFAMDGSTCRQMIRLAKVYIAKHCGSDISLGEVADYVNMNASYFSLLFKHEIGMTFTDYLIQYRIDRAKELLSSSNTKIYKVGEMIGFSSSQYFNRVFKHITGLTPKAFREQLQPREDLPAGREGE